MWNRVMTVDYILASHLGKPLFIPLQDLYALSSTMAAVQASSSTMNAVSTSVPTTKSRPQCGDESSSERQNKMSLDFIAPGTKSLSTLAAQPPNFVNASQSHSHDSTSIIRKRPRARGQLERKLQTSNPRNREVRQTTSRKFRQVLSYC